MINIQPAEYEDIPEYIRLQMPLAMLDGDFEYYLVTAFFEGHKPTTVLTISKAEAEMVGRALAHTQ